MDTGLPPFSKGRVGGAIVASRSPGCGRAWIPVSWVDRAVTAGLRTLPESRLEPGVGHGLRRNDLRIPSPRDPTERVEECVGTPVGGSPDSHGTLRGRWGPLRGSGLRTAVTRRPRCRPFPAPPLFASPGRPEGGRRRGALRVHRGPAGTYTTPGTCASLGSRLRRGVRSRIHTVATLWRSRAPVCRSPRWSHSRIVRLDPWVHLFAGKSGPRAEPTSAPLKTASGLDHRIGWTF